MSSKIAKIVIGSDHAGIIREYLISQGRLVEDVGCDSPASVDYPDYAKKVADMVLPQEESVRGIVICGTGLGISIAANKIPGSRCALCHDAYTAEMSRMHNNANILAMGSRVIGEGVAKQIVDIFLKTEFETQGRHSARVEKIHQLEAK